MQILANSPQTAPIPDQQKKLEWQSDELKFLKDLIENRRLTAVFQPILDFRSVSYIGFEGLIRGPENTPLHSPAQLFEAAERRGLRQVLERACRETVFRSFAKNKLPAKLFINSSLDCLNDDFFINGGTLELLDEIGLNPNRIVIEITENQHINDYPDIHRALEHFRKMGFQIAIDDLGEGFSNLRMWSEIEPDFVKIDKHFIKGIAEDKLKNHFVKAMQNLAESCSAQIIAEGIECETDCLAVRDLGITLGQGFLIAMPVSEPRTTPNETVSKTLRQQGIIVFPAPASGLGKSTVRSLLRRVPPASPATTNDDIFQRFEADSGLMSIPVVSEGSPLGLINRHEMTNNLARPFRRELFGRKTCNLLMDPMPLCIDEKTTIQDAGLIISRSTGRQLFDGFIVTAGGLYMGIVSTHKLVQTITEMQIQAARYANPLTQLPGNVPINEHIDRLLENKTPFHACYFDIDNFKPFNDNFGYRKGDDLIMWLSHTLREIISPGADFCGHIGGDDFMVLFQSIDWESRCQKALRMFEFQVSEYLQSGLKKDKGYFAEDRRGQRIFFPFPTLSIGAIQISPDIFESHRDVSAAAAEAKKNAKKIDGHSLFIERRKNNSEDYVLRAKTAVAA